MSPLETEMPPPVGDGCSTVQLRSTKRQPSSALTRHLQVLHAPSPFDQQCIRFASDAGPVALERAKARPLVASLSEDKTLRPFDPLAAGLRACAAPD